MKAIVNTGIGKVEFADMKKPEPGHGMVRVLTAACGICATDFTMIDGCERSHYPSILGHEWSGVIDEVGDGVDKNLIYKHCVADNVLSDEGEVGFEHPGAYGEFFLTESRNIQILPDDYDLVTASIIEPLAVSIRGFKRMRLEKKDNALIFGDGPIGLIMLMLLKLNGVKDVFVVGGRSERLHLAKELGAFSVMNYHMISGSLKDGIRERCGKKFYNIIEASGSPMAMNACFHLASPLAHILMLGDYGTNRADFELLAFLQNEYELIASNASSGAWEEAVKLATSGKISLERLITHVIPPSDFAKGFDLMRSRRGDVIKVVINWLS